MAELIDAGPGQTATDYANDRGAAATTNVEHVPASTVQSTVLLTAQDVATARGTASGQSSAGLATAAAVAGA